MLRSFAVTCAALIAGPALASNCLQVAQHGPRIMAASFDLQPEQVGIHFVGHASFRIETEQGVTAVTDFSGYWGEGDAPDIVTMNHAHSTHWTPNPDPAIAHVLRGWGDGEIPADHYLEVGDMLVRNVPTDIRRWDGSLEVFGNSIFVFEAAGLCIGHLGHLHHKPTNRHYGLIGRLDVVMVPVDGGYTMNQAAMIEVLQRFRARIVIPMHWFGESNLDRFLLGMASDFAVVETGGRDLVVSKDSLPARPTVMVLRPF